MRTERLAPLGFFLVLSFITIAYLFRMQENQGHHVSGKRLEEVIEEYRAARNFGFVTGGFVDDLETYLTGSLAVLNSKYNKKIVGYHFNGPIREDYINIYFVDNDPKNILLHFEPTCTYRGYKNIIICDLAFVKQMQSVPPVLSRRSNDIAVLDPKDSSPAAKYEALAEAVYQAFSKNILLWILGHELGHLAHSHGESHFISDAKPYFKFLKNIRAKTRSNEEVEADNFAIEVGEAGTSYETDPRGIKGLFTVQLYFALVAFINSLGTQLIAEQGHSSSLVHFVENRNTTLLIHQESRIHALFSRALDMQIALIAHYGYENTGYYQKLKDHIVFVR